MKVGEIYLIHKIQFGVYHLKLYFNMRRMVLISLKSNEKQKNISNNLYPLKVLIPIIWKIQ